MLPLQQMEKLHQRYLYGITTLLLSIFLVMIIANRHIGLSSYQQSYAVCTQQVVELTERVGACGQEQLTELKQCRSELMILKEVQGRFEESSTSSLTVIKQLEDLKASYSKQADIALKNQENCENKLNHTELERNICFQNISLLNGDNRELNIKLRTCSDQLTKWTQEADKLEAKLSDAADKLETKLSDAAKEKDEYVHHLKHEEIRYHVLFRNNVACSEQLTMCNEQLDECKLSKQEMKTAEEFKFNVLIIFIVVVVGMMGALVTVSVFRSNKQSK